jgi:hypothetical protein
VLSKKALVMIAIAAAVLLIVMGVWFVAANKANSDANTTDLNVTMTVHNVTTRNISFTFENPTKNEYIYGDPYELYVRQNDSWECVERY